MSAMISMLLIEQDDNSKNHLMEAPLRVDGRIFHIYALLLLYSIVAFQ